MLLSVDQHDVGIMMVYIVFISSTIFEMSFSDFSSKPSPVNGRLGLILSGRVVYIIVINLVALS